MRFAKYHALGNDYIVMPPDGPLPTPAQIRAICRRHHGVGGDGIVWGPLPHPEADAAVRIFNPDGSDAQMSGNGLRIFVRYCWDQGQREPLRIAVADRIVTARVASGGNPITIELGHVTFDSRAMPMSGPSREVLDESLTVEGRSLRFTAVSLGNPHCVIRRPSVSEAEARAWGPLVENDGRFPRRTNVQFVEVLDRANIKIEIWERGAGYTLASGSSSCAAVAAAVRHDWCDRDVTVHMPGGTLHVALTPEWLATLTGPVTPVMAGEILLDIN